MPCDFPYLIQPPLNYMKAICCILLHWVNILSQRIFAYLSIFLIRLGISLSSDYTTIYRITYYCTKTHNVRVLIYRKFKFKNYLGQCKPMLTAVPTSTTLPTPAVQGKCSTIDQHSISKKCKTRAPVYCTCFLAPLYTSPTSTALKAYYCSATEGFALPVHSKQMRLMLHFVLRSFFSVQKKCTLPEVQMKQKGTLPFMTTWELTKNLLVDECF